MSGDIALKELKTPVQALRLTPAAAYTRPTDAALDELADVINSHARVTILAGAGCAGAHAQLMTLADKIKAPMVHAMRGKECVEYDNPFDVGMTGLIGFSSGYYAMESCDLLLMLGTDFPYEQFFPKARIVQVDSRAENLGRRVRIDLGVVGDIRETLMLLISRINQKNEREHLDKAVQHYAKARTSLDELAQEGSLEDRVHPQYVARLLSELAADDAVYTCDVGTPSIWAARYLHMNGRRRLLGSFNHGSMANALAQAIGAQAAYPVRQVIAMCGDGGFTMLMGDFLTLNQHHLPVKVIVFNNSALGFVELEMKAVGLLNSATELNNSNFAKMAEAVGIRGFRVEQGASLREALSGALAHDGPALVDVVVNRHELAMPPHVTMDQVKGFGLFALKAVLSGQGNELVDLAKSNWFR